MKKLILGAAAFALLSGSAFAQNTYNRDRDNGPRYEDRGGPRGDRTTDTFRPGGTIPYEYRAGGHYAFYDWRGAGLPQPRGANHWFKISGQYVLADQHTGKISDVRRVTAEPLRFREGGVVPYEYRVGGKYITYDWRGMGLDRPPRGYQWMHIGDMYVLANQQNGMIKDVEPERGRGRR